VERLQLPVLQGAIAYRQDFQGREQWANRWPDPIPVACPSGCAVECDLIISMQSSDGDVHHWIEMMLVRMERECPNHADYILL
jgi:hypothetical protein